MLSDLYVSQLLLNPPDPHRGRTGWDGATSLLNYDEPWRRHRKVMNQKLRPGAVSEYQPIQLKHTRFTLQILLVADIYIIIGSYFNNSMKRPITSLNI